VSSFIHTMIILYSIILGRVPIFGPLLSHDTTQSSKDVCIIGGGVVPWTLIRARYIEIRASPWGRHPGVIGYEYWACPPLN